MEDWAPRRNLQSIVQNRFAFRIAPQHAIGVGQVRIGRNKIRIKRTAVSSPPLPAPALLEAYKNYPD